MGMMCLRCVTSAVVIDDDFNASSSGNCNEAVIIAKINAYYWSCGHVSGKKSALDLFMDGIISSQIRG